MSPGVSPHDGQVVTGPTRFLVRDGRRLAVDTTGQGGVPLVFVHGWCTDRTGFGPQVDHFSANHRVITIDLRGHGQSDPADRYRIADFADDVLWIIEQLALDRPVLVGHSMGGMVVVEAGATAPDALSAVIALDSPFVEHPGLTQAAESQIALLVQPDGAERLRPLLDQLLLGPYDDTARLAPILDGMVTVPPEIAIAALRGVADWPSERALLRCQLPVLCVFLAVGGITDPTPLIGAMANVFTAQTVGSGHFIQLEVPDQVNAMIDRFLQVTARSS